MIRRLLRPAFALAARWLDDTVPVDVLHRWLNTLLELLTNSRGTLDARGANDVALACSLAVGHRGHVVVPTETAAADRDLPQGPFVQRGRVLLGTGRWLDRLGAGCDGATPSMAARQFECVLRHVEVRRRRALADFLPAVESEQVWLERHDVAIAFCRHARRTGDLRLLNAAFKLNDWAFTSHRRLRRGARLARYLLALAEQESAARQLLAPHDDARIGAAA